MGRLFSLFRCDLCRYDPRFGEGQPMRKLIHVMVAGSVLWPGRILPWPRRQRCRRLRGPPKNVTLFPLPETMKIPSAVLYTYGIVNDRAVVVDRMTRKVVHI